MSLSDLLRAVQDLTTEARMQHAETASLLTQLSVKIDMLDHSTYMSKLLPASSAKSKPSKASKDKASDKASEKAGDQDEEELENKTSAEDKSGDKTGDKTGDTPRAVDKPKSVKKEPADSKEKEKKVVVIAGGRKPNKREVFKKLFLENNPCLNPYLTDKVKEQARVDNPGWKGLKLVDSEKEQEKFYYAFMTQNYDKELVDMKKNLIDENEKPDLVSKE